MFTFPLTVPVPDSVPPIMSTRLAVSVPSSWVVPPVWSYSPSVEKLLPVPTSTAPALVKPPALASNAAPPSTVKLPVLALVERFDRALFA